MADRRLRVLRRGADGETDDAGVLQALDETTVEIRLAGDRPDWGTQLVAEALADLLGRLFPRIAVRCDPDARSDERLPPGPERLLARLEATRAHGVEPREAGTPAVTVQVGAGDEPADLYVDGGGWQGYVGTSPSRLPRDEPTAATIGPLSAAARAAAHVYVLAMRDFGGGREPPASVYWSGLGYVHAADPIAMPAPEWSPYVDAVLAGAGSVGGAAIYLLARTPRLQGRLDIADPQSLEPTNPDRAILATAPVSAREEAKADVAVESLRHLDGLTAQPHVTDLGGFLASRPREQPLPLTLCAVDSVHARRSIQDCLPLELINAACDPSDSVVSVHRTGTGPCVMCLFMKRILDREQALFRLIARNTNLNERMVGGMMANSTPLDRRILEGVENFRGLPRGALKDYEGRTLRQLWHGELVYGGHQISTESGAVVAVAAPWVTAFAGFLLASEALKAGDPLLEAYRLGPRGALGAGRYGESTYGSPAYGQLTQPERWPGEQCLCNSPRRRSLIIERYELSPDEYPI